MQQSLRLLVNEGRRELRRLYNVEPNLEVNLRTPFQMRHHLTTRRQIVGDALDRRQLDLRRMVWRSPPVGNHQAEMQPPLRAGAILQHRETAAPHSLRVVQVEGAL